MTVDWLDWLCYLPNKLLFVVFPIIYALFSAGTFGGIIMSVLPVFMLRQARRQGNRQPCWQCGRIASLPVQLLVVALFSGAGIYALCSLAGLLPPAW